MFDGPPGYDRISSETAITAVRVGTMELKQIWLRIQSEQPVQDLNDSLEALNLMCELAKHRLSIFKAMSYVWKQKEVCLMKSSIKRSSKFL